MVFMGLVMLLLGIGSGLKGQDYELFSPGKKIKLKIGIKDKILYSVFLNSQEVIAPSPISMNIRGKERLGERPKIIDTIQKSVNESLNPIVPVKNSVVPNVYEAISLKFEGQFGLEFRVYDEGVAYRFFTDFKETVFVLSEEVVFNFKKDHDVYFAEDTGFFTHQEKPYRLLPLSEISSDKMGYPPALVALDGGVKVALTEADLENYAGMYLRGSDSPSQSFSLVGHFPGVALEENQTRDRDVRVQKYADYIAETEGKRTFPWRVMAISEKDGDLVTNEMVYLLAKPLQIGDPTWIKPGKVAWDWWNANNVYGVEFSAGINTETYLYYIDFAAKYGIEYVILDEGWYELGDLFKINPEIDMERILHHAEKKNVGIILWVIWKTLEDQLHEALNQFQSWGVKGIKVDFMQRDDQWMVNYYHKIAREAAKRRLLVDFHGAYKPTGLRRAYPNVLTREGVLGLEHNKWGENATPEHNVTLPFIRMLAGPMDYTPGAMLNAQKKNFKAIFNRPMSMGTRCHQLAMYVVFESPLQMLADSPSNYLREEECMEFLSQVPCTWDKTIVLDAKVGDYILIARQSGAMWYLGAMTDWSPRDLELELNFLTKGNFQMVIYKDGLNAHRFGNDYQKEVRVISSTDRIKIHLAPGGGWAARLTPKK